MTNHEQDILKCMGAARKRNISVFAELAELVEDAEALGFKERQPGRPDVTLMIISAALEQSPHRARVLLRQVVANDKEVTRWAEMLVA